MRKEFFTFCFVAIGLIGLGFLILPESYFPIHTTLSVFLCLIVLLGLRDAFQNKHTIIRNFPVLGHFRYLLEMVRPEIQQYFIESNT